MLSMSSLAGVSPRGTLWMRGEPLGGWVIGAVSEGQGVAWSLHLKWDSIQFGLAVMSIPEEIADHPPVFAGQILSARMRNARSLD
jgi:hypothetical protein